MKNFYVTSPNQKVICTSKTKSDAEHVYSRVNVEASLTAARELSDRAYKLYSRMTLHLDGFSYALSPAAIKSEIGISESKCRNAVNELIKKGYLVLAPERKNFFIFYEYPQIDCLDNATNESAAIATAANPIYHGADPVPDTAELPEDEDVHAATPLDQDTDVEGCVTDTEDHIINTDGSSVDNNRMVSPISSDNFINSDREINQDIPINTPENIPEDIPSNTEACSAEDYPIDHSSYCEWDSQSKAEKERQLEQERQLYRELIKYRDPDDWCHYDHLNPDRVQPFETLDIHEVQSIGLDDCDLPF